jgi:hypothetical protein
MARYDWPVDVGAASPQSLLRRRPGLEGRRQRHFRPAIAGDVPSEPMHVRAALQPSLSRSEPGVPYLPRRVSAGGHRMHIPSFSPRYLIPHRGGLNVLHFLPPMNRGVSVEMGL